MNVVLSENNLKTTENVNECFSSCFDCRICVSEGEIILDVLLMLCELFFYVKQLEHLVNNNVQI